MTYFGPRLSENISRREPEGYLICLNVPVARTGTQEYLPSELGLPEPDARLIPVLRPAEEIFSPACIASFEGMPVTDDHPAGPEGVTAENIRRLQKGHAHNVRRGAGAESDLLLADLIITDPVLIGEILAGKREISCGYNYLLCEEDGNFIQREIRGNHVAVVDAGRAGPRVSIKDTKTNMERSSRMNTKTRKNTLWQARLLARMARDGDVEGLAEIITEMMEDPAAPAAEAALPEAETPAAGTPAAPVVVETPVDQPVVIDCGPEILEALRQIIALLSAPVSGDCDTPETRDEDPDPTAAAAAETVAGEMAENVAAAAVEAVAETLNPDLAADEGEDPVEALVAEILESDEDQPESPAETPVPGEEILSGVLEPTEDEDGEDPDARAADALRAALASFRPQLKRMTPRERQRFNADVAARMKRLTRKAGASGKPNAYAALRKAASRDHSARTLGQKIMASRNANLRKGA